MGRARRGAAAAATSRYGAGRVAALYLTHALSRGLASKCIVAVVTRGGATALSLAQVVRASLIVVLVSVAFCSTDPRQCLDGAGAAGGARRRGRVRVRGGEKTQTQLGGVERRRQSVDRDQTPREDETDDSQDERSEDVGQASRAVKYFVL